MSARLFGERQVDMPLSVVKNTRCPLVLVTVAVLACDGTHSFELSQEVGRLMWLRMQTLSPALNLSLFASGLANALLRFLDDGELS